MHYTVFNKDTGLVVGYGSDSDITHEKGHIEYNEDTIMYFGEIFSSEEKMWKDNKVVNASKKDLAKRLTAEDIREGRNNLLKNTDYIFSTDIALTDSKKEEWKVYRQSLRDLTNHKNFPALVEEDWPVKPE